MLSCCFNKFVNSYTNRHLTKKNQAIFKALVRFNSGFQNESTSVLAKLDTSNAPPDLQPVLRDLLAENKLEEKKKDINQLPNFMKKLQAIVLKNEDKKDLLLGDFKKLKLSKTYISNKLAASLINNKDFFSKDEIEIVSFLEYLTYDNLKSIENYFLEKYKTDERQMPISLYNVFFKNYKQILQSKKEVVTPDILISDVRKLLEYRNWEIKHKFNNNIPVLNDDEQLLVEESYSDFLQQVILSLKFKYIKSSMTNKQMLENLPSVYNSNSLKLKEINLLISSFSNCFGAVENRVSQTQMIQILGHFNNFEKQWEIFQHMKFLSLKKNAPDKSTYLNMLIAKLKQKDLLGGLDLLDEYKENMKTYYEKIYLNKLSVNQRGKQQIPLLPVYFNDPEFFEKLHKLYNKLEDKHQLDLDQCDSYYIGVPIELRIMFIRIIIAVCSNFKVDKASAITPESIMGYRFKAWDLLYGILLELTEGNVNTTSKNNNSVIAGLLGEDRKNLDSIALPEEEESEISIKTKHLIKHISEIDFNNPVVANALNSLNSTTTSTNEKSTQLNKDFVKVCMEIALFEKDVELARCIYVKFFNEFILPKFTDSKSHKNKTLKKSLLSEFSKKLSFRERELWVQVYHSLLKTYYNNDLSKLSSTNLRSSVKKIMKLVNEKKKSKEEISSQQNLNSLKIYQVNPKTNWIRSKLMEDIGVENGEFKQLNSKDDSAIKIPFLPLLKMNEENELKIMESKAIHDWHYYNIGNDFKNLTISKKLDGEDIGENSVSIPSKFILELNAIIESSDLALLKFNIKNLLTKWFVYNCHRGLINPLLTQEGILLSYTSIPMKYSENYEEFTKRLDKHFVNIMHLDKLVDNLKENKTNSLIEELYLETFKVWKDESTFITQLEYSSTNNDINFMKRTWNERLSNKNYSLNRNTNLKKKPYPLELTDSDKRFYKKYVKTQFENDLILESYEFVKSTNKYIDYEYNDLKSMIDVLKELEDFNKVDFIKKIINENKKNLFLKGI